MSPELRQMVRGMSLRDIRSATDPQLGFLASGAGRFRNPFSRDVAWSMAESLSQEENYNFAPEVLVEPGKRTLRLILTNQSSIDIKRGILPGKGPHELHTKTTSQSRLEKLRQDGMQSERDLDPDEFVTLITYHQADDVNALITIAFEAQVRALDQVYSPEAGQEFLKEMWPYLEANILHDVFYAHRNGDGLLRSFPENGGKGANKTWRDSYDAFTYKGQIPKPPYTLLANNFFAIKGFEAGGRLADRLGYGGFAESLRRISQRARLSLHERFLVNGDFSYFAPLLDRDNQPVLIETNEPLIGLFTEAIYPEVAPLVGDRVLQPGLLTEYGTRTRSTSDLDFDEKSYHRGAVWTHMDTSGAIGAKKYGLDYLASELTQRSCHLAAEVGGSLELTGVTRDGQRIPYEEEGVEIACLPQSWAAHGLVAVTTEGFLKAA